MLCENELWHEFVAMIQDQLSETPVQGVLRWTNLFTIYCIGFRRGIQEVIHDIEEANNAKN